MDPRKPKSQKTLNLENFLFLFFFVFLLPFNPTFRKCVKTVNKKFQSVHYLIIQRLFLNPTTALNTLGQEKDTISVQWNLHSNGGGEGPSKNQTSKG